jgi:16S rRNA (guanine527-N7)-methyltransferase
MTELAVRDELLTGLPDETRSNLRTYRDLLFRWNSRFNLTAIREPEQIDARLIADGLRLLPAIDDVLAKRPHEPRMIDLGTGAGLPGLVIKIARPEIDITLVDATRKKIQFVQNVIEELELPHARTIHGRAEDIGQMSEYRESFDLVTARGVAALPTLLEYTVPLLDIGGWFIFPKGESLDEELRHGKRAAHTLGARIESSRLLPGHPDEPVTRLVRGVKIGLTPRRYPRRAGIPKEEPLGRDGR